MTTPETIGAARFRLTYVRRRGVLVAMRWETLSPSGEVISCDTTADDDDLRRVIRAAREEERGAPDGTLPSPEAIVRAFRRLHDAASDDDDSPDDLPIVETASETAA
jgi:hypothetical protein